MPARAGIPGISKAQRVMIEQAIARGDSKHFIATRHDIDPAVITTAVTTKVIDPEQQALIEKAVAEAAEPRGFTFWDMTDASLVYLRRQYLRMIEDNPGRPHAKIDAWLASIRWVRLVRWCLHMRYGAVDDHTGTHSWDRYHRFGDPPSYTLARNIDYKRWELCDHPRMPKRGLRRHIIDWDRFVGTGT